MFYGFEFSFANKMSITFHLNGTITAMTPHFDPNRKHSTGTHSIFIAVIRMMRSVASMENIDFKLN